MKRSKIKIQQALVIGCITFTCITLMGCSSSKIKNKNETPKNSVVSSNNTLNNPSDKKIGQNIVPKNTDNKTEKNVTTELTNNSTKNQVSADKTVVSINKNKKTLHKAKYTVAKVNKSNKINNKKLYTPKYSSTSKNKIITDKKKPSKEIQAHYKLTYSNLIDSNTQTKVSNLLKESNINQENINSFIDCVNDYNNIVGTLKSFKNGFTSIKTQQVDYPLEYTYDKWNSKKFDYGDANCRITAFRLFRNNILSSTKFTGDNIDLMFDLDTIKNNPLCKFSSKDRDKFINLFAAIPAETTKDIKKHAKTIQKEWENRGIKFVENSKVSMINVFLHYIETKNVFIGHSGILINDKEGLFFVEKYGPLLPYQISKFNSKNELKNYLLDRLDVAYGQESSKPIIMENDTLMK